MNDEIPGAVKSLVSRVVLHAAVSYCTEACGVAWHGVVVDVHYGTVPV